MPQQFEPQTEPQTQPLVSPKKVVPSALAPAASKSESYNTPETLSNSEIITQHSPQQTLAPEGEQTWQALLHEWQQSRRSRFRPLSVLSLSMAGMGVPVFLLTWPASVDPTLHTLLFGCWLYFWGMMLLASVIRPHKLTTKQTVILKQLGDVEDTQAAGPLLEAWQATTNVQARTEIGKILVRLLPRLRKEDGANLTPAQRRLLYATIDYFNASHQPEIALACLEAVEQIGDVHALPPLARLIVHDAPSQQSQQIRERARQCLTDLTQSLDFGTKADIPNWIAKLPYTTSNGGYTLPDGRDNALIALFALIQLLPQLQPSDGGLLKASQRAYLAESWRVMQYPLFGGPGANAQQARLGTAFSYAVLHALEQIGTGRDLRLSEWLLSDVPVEELPQLRLKARSVNAILERRREKEQAGQTLLRGASAPTAAPAELLRPAEATSSVTNPRELLRPEEERS